MPNSALARPVAAFASGGTEEMVRSGETGLIVRAGDTQALGRAFATLAADSSMRERMGRAGARRVGEQFTLERHLDRMEALFRSVSG